MLKKEGLQIMNKILFKVFKSDTTLQIFFKTELEASLCYEPSVCSFACTVEPRLSSPLSSKSPDYILLLMLILRGLNFASNETIIDVDVDFKGLKFCK